MEQHGKRRTWVRTGLAASAVVFVLGLVAGMATLILRHIDDLSVASSDNMQWSLAQADVEFLRFRLSLADARAEPDAAQLSQLRQRFDIFYSRMATLEEADTFHTLREDASFAAPVDRVQGFLQATVPLIDGSDAALAAALPELDERAAAAGENVRRFSLAALSALAAQTETRRIELLTALVLMAAILAVLFAGLLLLAGSLSRLARLAQERAHEVQEGAARLQTVADTSLDAIFVTDSEGRVRQINRAAQTTLGLRPADAMGASIVDLLFPETLRDPLRNGALRFLGTGTRPGPEERQFETMAQDIAGRAFPVEISFDRGISGGKPVFVVFLRDISRRKAAEDGLTEARDRALAGERAKAEFLAVMSHEMRTPLNGLLGTMQLLRDHALTERQSELLDRMSSSGRLLLGLVNDVLDLAKFEAGKMEVETRPFSLARLLDGVVQTTAPLAAAQGNSVEWRWVGPEQPGAVGDMRRLRQMLLNLVGNSVKFTRDGSVEIEVERLRGDEDLVEFRVIDTGIGIAEEDLDRIFQDFVTLDSSYARTAGGTGLGLGIARRLAALMDGEMGAESTPGEGSLFWLRVPLAPLREAPEPQTARTASFGDEAYHDAAVRTASRRRPLRLLLVEDNEINRFVAREMLEAEGHTVVEAANGRAGVERAEAEAFDAILMDISMPVMDGPEAARRIRAGQGASADAPIIAVTAHALPEEIESFRAAGMERAISKPVDRADLIGALDSVTGGADEAEAGYAGFEAAPQRAPLVDERQLQSLAESLAPETRARLMDRFLTETEGTVAALAARAPGAPEIAPIAHKIAGSCGTFGMVALADALRRIETRVKRGERLDADELRALPDLWAESRAALLAWHAAA
ncbi:hypothetical protein RISW2_01190 [Roseivivax isoporae LMG 25204]|uniref:histidine kinase n=1 Tax=Roseivivax isoporae LMG 25204 TaxID=1449351 RepID=X7FB20_9RHOB|nr:hypothetical protein RISW2_01190 [Roseivivax isoporae LMG 25204]